MESRPDLKGDLTSEDFLNFYYLKEELIRFCKDNNLPTSGSKGELTKRIAYFLESGKILVAAKKVTNKNIIKIINEDTLIENNFVCSQYHREFFKEKIGKSFSFNVAFQKWLKSNSGKTYKDAVNAYHQIIDTKKNSKTTIDKQFEYNTYIRDFFADNKDKNLTEAIKCWKYKKSLPGSNCYEVSDLVILVDLKI